MPKLAIHPFLRGNFWQFSNNNVPIWDHFFPLLFPKDSESLKILDIQLREVGAKRHLNGTSKVNTQTNKHTDRQTDISTYRKHRPRGLMLWKSKFVKQEIFSSWERSSPDLISRARRSSLSRTPQQHRWWSVTVRLSVWPANISLTTIWLQKGLKSIYNIRSHNCCMKNWSKTLKIASLEQKQSHFRSSCKMQKKEQRSYVWLVKDGRQPQEAVSRSRIKQFRFGRMRN